MKISLEQPWDGFVDKAIRDGRFASADAVVEAGLRLLQRDESMQQELRAKLDAAIAKGGEVSDDDLDRATADEAAELRRNGIGE